MIIKFKNIPQNNSNIWITSDTHFNHKNIVKGTSNWTVQEKGSSHDVQSLRDFPTLEKHDDLLINNINKYVKQDDVLYHCGDFSFNGHENVKKFRERINCKEVHLILGNHDEWLEHPECEYRDLFASVDYYKELTTHGKKFILSHYSMRVWKGSHKGFYHCFGHSHSSLEHLPNGKSMDVGIDNSYKIFKEYRPFNIKEIINILDKREINFIDHHSEKTNV